MFILESIVDVLKSVPEMTWTPGVPERFRGLSRDELKRQLSSVPKIVQTIPKKEVHAQSLDHFDWAEQAPECVNVIRDQGGCGSCWAFSSVGVFSDTRCIKKRDAKRIQYSEQYVVSCDTQNMGCQGGYQTRVWGFLESFGTVQDECVPYTSGATGEAGACPTQCTKEGVEGVMQGALGHWDVAKSIKNIMDALPIYGPLTTQFVVYEDFMTYTGGIYQHITGSQLGGHAVEVVGYGIENGVEFWKIKNSWGPAWGEKGYFRIIKGVDECGIEDLVISCEV